MPHLGRASNYEVIKAWRQGLCGLPLPVICNLLPLQMTVRLAQKRSLVCVSAGGCSILVLLQKGCLYASYIKMSIWKQTERTWHFLIQLMFQGLKHMKYKGMDLNFLKWTLNHNGLYWLKMQLWVQIISDRHCLCLIFNSYKPFA